MKILIFSDTHARIQPMLDIIFDENPDAVIHLGDLSSDIREVAKVYPNLTYYSVAGNNDFGFMTPQDQVLKINGKTIFLTHGHRYDVKNRISKLKDAAKLRCADIVMFGHTHKPLYEFDGTLHILNPGAIYRGVNGIKTYGVAIIDENIKIEIMEY